MNIEELERIDTKKMYMVYDDWPKIARSSLEDRPKKIDVENPQLAASTTKAFEQIRFLPHIYREKAKAALNTLPNDENLSRDTSEILHKIRAFL